MLKKAWLTPHTPELSTLTLESLNLTPEHMRLSADQRTFPAANPEHHVTVIGLLYDNDLRQIMFAIKDYLDGKDA